jgi:hypothetical protein
MEIAVPLGHLFCGCGEFLPADKNIHLHSSSDQQVFRLSKE